MTCVEPLRMRMNRSFSHYTNGVWFYLSRKMEIILLRGIGCLIDRYRWQARSYRGSRFTLGAGLPAKRPSASAQNNQMPQELMLLKSQHCLQRTQH